MGLLGEDGTHCLAEAEPVRQRGEIANDLEEDVGGDGGEIRAGGRGGR